MTATLWIASANQKKRNELERLLAAAGGLELKTMADLAEPLDIVEDRPDFAGNAEVKAVTLARLVGAPALGDDSGLRVDALGGAPGVHSARWAGPDATDHDRIDKLLAELGDRPDRSARFVCHLCLADATGKVLARIEESCEGRILTAPRGEAGFGYDPVFVAAAFQRPGAGEIDPSFAELSAEQKDAVSHRGKALRALAAWLTEHPL
ncbi:MAG: non-canonical purine NTP pyrophosphatase [Planctomycetes bacterium]|nr:non-canonical purine NTP pyrophosphatase [Planctomycetota bacterium]